MNKFLIVKSCYFKMLSGSSEYEDTEFEDDFDDLDEFEEIEETDD